MKTQWRDIQQVKEPEYKSGAWPIVFITIGLWAAMWGAFELIWAVAR